MSENKALNWIKISWIVSILLGLMFFGIYSLIFSRLIKLGISMMLIQSIGGLILTALYWIFGNVLYKKRNLLSAVVLFVITILDTCYRIYLGAILGTIIFLVCAFVFFKGIQAARYLQNEK